MLVRFIIALTAAGAALIALLTAARAGPEEFDVFDVTIEVLRQDGSPVEGALVRAISDEWSWRHPRDAWEWEATGADGRASFPLTRGAWSFVAGGDYAFSSLHPGRAFYVVRRAASVTSDTTLTLQADAEIACSFHAIGGGPLHVDEIRATPADHAPGWVSTPCGFAHGGAATLETTSATGAVLLGVVHRDISVEPAYILEGAADPGGSLDLSPSPGSVATLRFSSFDKDGLPGNGNVEIRPLGFDANNFLWDFNTEPTRILYTNVPRVRINYRFLHLPGEYFYFCGEITDLAAGTDTSCAFGGMTSCFLHVIPRNNAAFGERTQVWIQVSDAHGHELAWPPTPDPIPFTVYEDGAEAAHQDFTSYFVSFPQWFVVDSTTTCVVDVPVGSFGTAHLEGPLFAPEWDYNTTGIANEHFDVDAPGQYDARSWRMVDFMEQYLAALEPLAWGAIADTVQYVVDVDGGGFPWEQIPLKVPLSVHQNSDPREPWTLFFPGHEMGHVRLLHPACGRTLTVPFQEYGESYATLLCLAGFQGLVDPTVLAAETGSHDLFFRHLARGDPVADVWDRTETLQFVEEYVRRNFGWETHRQIMFRYGWEMSERRQLLFDNGFSEWEAIAVLYSQLAGTNLGWLWDLAALDITQARVQEGLDLIGGMGVPGNAPPRALWLAPVRPNPARGPLEIAFALPRAGTVRLAVYDVAGQCVASLADGPCAAGRHAVRWEAPGRGGARLASGVYFLRLEAGGQTRTRKLTMVR